MTYLLRCSLPTVFLLLATCAASRGSEPVSVELHNGKTWTAQVDSQTDDQRLWLRFSFGGTIIRRAIDWPSIAEITHDGTVIDADAAKALASSAAPRKLKLPAPRPAGDVTSEADRARKLLDFGRRISSVDFDAHLANWDRDVEFDGIALRVFPLDAQGRLTKVRGTLEAELVVGRHVDFNDVPRSRGHKPRQLGSWRVAINKGEIDEDGVLVKLPFQAAHPEFDTKWAAYALVHVRLVVPGHGVFDHSIDGIRIRPYAPLRDAMERQGRPRFLPTEQTGRGRRSN